VDCTACTGYPGQSRTTEDFPCPDGCGSYTICYTPLGCPNYTITPCPGCPPPPPPPPATQFCYCIAYGYSIPCGDFCPTSPPPPPPAATPPPPPPAASPPPPAATPPPPAAFTCEFATCSNDPGQQCCFWVGGACYGC
jgi:hypothetical protein